MVGGKVLAGPYVRNACLRHLRDLVDGPKRGLVWDVDAANRFIGFCRDVCRLGGDRWEGKPFVLNGWQCFVGGSLFGWKRKIADPTEEAGFRIVRRFTTAYIETGKGSGKSPLAAAIGLYGLTSDGQARAEIYAAATKKDQAMVLFRDAVAMVDQSPDLGLHVDKTGVADKTWNLYYRAASAFFRAIGSDTDGQSGPRPHMALLDEIHEHKTNVMVEMMKLGQKGLSQPLMLMITNSGVDRTSVCFEYHEAGIKISAGDEQDDSFFAFICALDMVRDKRGREVQEDPFKDESCWPKVNPSLEESDLPGIDYLRGQVKGARVLPSKAALVRRLNFCQWVEASNPAIPRHVWEACEDAGFDAERLRGRKCWGGLDLSSTTDLTAEALMFEPVDDDPYWRLFARFWIPGDELAEKEQRDKVPYLMWAEKGYINALPGRSINKLAVALQCVKDASAFNMQELAFDRWRMEDFKRILDDEGVELPLVPHGQGYQSMTPAVEAFETTLLAAEIGEQAAQEIDGDAESDQSPEAQALAAARRDRRARMSKPLRHDGNPVLTWCAANAVYTSDGAGCRKPDKKKARGRIDGIVAAIMAASRASRGAGVGKSFWEAA